MWSRAGQDDRVQLFGEQCGGAVLVDHGLGPVQQTERDDRCSSVRDTWPNLYENVPLGRTAVVSARVLNRSCCVVVARTAGFGETPL